MRTFRLLSVLIALCAFSLSALGGTVRPAKAAANDNAVEWDGLFHDQSPLFFTPFEPTAADPITVRLRTFKNDITSANVKYYDAGTSTTNWIPMSYVGDDVNGTFSFYTGVIPASSSKKYYRIQVNDGSDTDWVGRYGITDNEETYADFFVFPDYKIPEWSKNAIYYQIFPDRFYDGDPANNLGYTLDTSGANPDHVAPIGGACPTGSYQYGAYCAYTHASWTELPAQPPNGEDFFGGDLPGIISKIDPYLKNTLGVNALYLNPIFHSPSNHKYDTQDYDTVDPHFGTNGDLQTLIATAHNATGPGNYKMSVMLDGVFNHSSDWHKWMDKYGQYATDGAYESQTSVWYNRYKFNTWPTSYCGWFGYDSLPKLDFSVTSLRDEIYRDSNSVMQRYLKAPYGIDGWRYDVANEISSITNGCDGTDNHAIWQDIRPYVKATNPEALMLGEFWQNGNSWILGANEWDSLMNYNAFNIPVSKWINCVEVHGENPGCLDVASFNGWVNGARNDYPFNVQTTLMSSLSTHDTSRFLFRAGGSIQKMKLATIFQMTWVGAPSVYYGDEVGLTGDNDPDNRRPFNWTQSSWDQGLLSLNQSLIAARKSRSYLRTGAAKTLVGGVDGANNTFAFGRWDNTGWALVGLNNSDSPQRITLNAWDLSIPNGTVMTDLVSGATYTVSGSVITIPALGARNGVVLVANIAIPPTATPTVTVTATSTATTTATATITPPRPDTIGVYKDGQFVLRNTNTGGFADITTYFGGDPSDLPVAADWNGDSADTIGVYRSSVGVFLLSDANTAPSVAYELTFGNPSDVPFAGRWTNDMTHDGVGVYRGSNGVLYQKKQLTSGFSDFFAIYGNPGDQAVSGDWDGNGFDSIGIYRPADQTWFLSNNSQPTGVTLSDINFTWTIDTNPGVVGDWDGDGVTTVGYLTHDGVFVLHMTNATAGSDTIFAFGMMNGSPISGKWIAGSRPPLTSGIVGAGGLINGVVEGGGAE